MRELFTWIDRLRSLEASSDADHPAAVSEHYFRAATPSPLDFDKSVVRMLDTRRQVELFGDLPASLSVLCWADDKHSEGNHLQNQQIATALGAVMTLALDRRIRIAAGELSVSMEGSPIKHFVPSQVNDRELIGPVPDRPKELIESTLRDVVGLPETERAAIGAAIDLHYAAVLLHDVDLNAAYALAVAALETLSQQYGTKKMDWSDWEHADRFDTAFRELNLTPEQAERMRVELLRDRHLRLRQGFADYVCDRLPAGFWDSKLTDFLTTMTVENSGEGRFTGVEESQSFPITQFVPRDRATLRRRLLAAYDARSLYVHSGGRRVTTMTGFMALIPTNSVPREPIAFAGIRRILVTLIRTELEACTTPIDLPSLVLSHGADPDAAQ